VDVRILQLDMISIPSVYLLTRRKHPTIE